MEKPRVLSWKCLNNFKQMLKKKLVLRKSRNNFKKYVNNFIENVEDYFEYRYNFLLRYNITLIKMAIKRLKIRNFRKFNKT